MPQELICESSDLNRFISASTASRSESIPIGNFTAKNYLTVTSNEFTPGGYRIETVAKIIHAKNSPSAKKFNNAKEFLVWLKSHPKK